MKKLTLTSPYSFKLLVLASASLVCHSANAHGVWVANHADVPSIVLGESSENNAYDTKKVVYAQAFDEQGKKIESSIVKNSNNVTFKPNSAMKSVAVFFDHGFWSQKMDGKWVNQPKTDFKQVKKSTHAIKTSLSILDDAKVPALSDLKELELVVYPLSSHLNKTKIGDKIEVLVLHNGKPLADAKLVGDFVNDFETVVATTNKEGIASIVVRNHGLNVIATGYKTKTTGNETKKSDSKSYKATLAFNNFHDGH